MATALDDLPAVTRVRDNGSDDARLFSLLDELRKCEKCRDDLLDHLWSEHSDQVEAAAGRACDAEAGGALSQPRRARSHA